jgi:hypothetical protein
VALGPAVQVIADATSAVLNEGEGYPELHFMKISAKMDEKPVQDAQGKTDVLRVPTVEFEGRVQEVGGRQVATAHSDFMTKLKQRLTELGGLELSGDAGLNSAAGTFKFRIAQTQFPEAVEAARNAEKGP